MSKSKKYSHKKYRRKTRKLKGSKPRRNYRRKTRSKNVGRGLSSNHSVDENKVQCSMCEKHVDKNSNPLIPQICLEKNSYCKAHRICQKCWWGDKDSIGFAKEGISHKCPGCEKGLPLNNYVKQHTGPIEVIDLLDTDE
jgi:hypothetical protein